MPTSHKPKMIRYDIVARLGGVIKLSRTKIGEAFMFQTYDRLPTFCAGVHVEGELFTPDFHIAKVFLDGTEGKNTLKLVHKIKAGFPIFTEADFMHFDSFNVRPADFCLFFNIAEGKPPFKSFMRRYALYIMRGFELKIALDTEIIQAYSQIRSCLSDVASDMPKFYGVKANKSLNMLVLKKNGAIVARAVLRVQSRKVVKIYGEHREVFTKLAREEGYSVSDSGFNQRALVGARLPIVVDDGGFLQVPYIDCEDQSIYLSLADDGEPDCLVIASCRNDVVLLGEGTGHGATVMKIVNRTSSYSEYFEIEHALECCACGREIGDDDCGLEDGGDAYCNDCIAYCPECDGIYPSTATFVPALQRRTPPGRYTEHYVCERCAECADTVPIFWN